MLLKTKLIATLTALSLTIAAPAHALGKNERNVLKGVAATVIIGAIVNDLNNKNAQTRHVEQPSHRGRYVEPQYVQPRYVEPRYVQPRYVEPRHSEPRRVKSHYGSSVHNTAAAKVFNNYSRAERVEIQRQLARHGYYHGSYDGAFGPRTHRAIAAFARDYGNHNALDTRRGAYRVYEALLG
ncbi:Putative peptidoglycan binding domain-containing protein [Pseudorhodobacter antarcticus]|uniref:Putative peptidoglycan binding domain-containing protein n=2 Tax=Pseudorhodobacter antarcticus TaxID=1077947 RepID=A0A1H8F6I7_9RHOB|nr:Putative peptidoglycan binding domain-containing protein [Pseudorhodobacter antarcticus]